MSLENTAKDRRGEGMVLKMRRSMIAMDSIERKILEPRERERKSEKDQSGEGDIQQHGNSIVFISNRKQVTRGRRVIKRMMARAIFLDLAPKPICCLPSTDRWQQACCLSKYSARFCTYRADSIDMISNNEPYPEKAEEGKTIRNNAQDPPLTLTAVCQFWRFPVLIWQNEEEAPIWRATLSLSMVQV